jgi:hypothetical protein
MHSRWSIWDFKLLFLRKLFAVLICTSFVLAPLDVVFAQDAGTGTAPIDSGSTTPPSPPTPPAGDFSIPGVSSPNLSTPDASTPAPSDTTGAGVPPSPDSAPATTPPASPTPPAPTTPTPPGPPPPSGGSNVGPTVPTPGIFTSMTSEQNVSGETGAFTQNIKLDIPPGRNGLQPDLSLIYNSQKTEDGIVGYGWSVSIPYIQRGASK